MASKAILSSFAMASKALLLFARAARSAAAVTYRVASLAERRALSPGPGAVATASDAPGLSGGRSATASVPTHSTAEPPPAMDSSRTGSWVASAPSSKDLSKPGGGRVEFVPKEEDLESDEALWDLYKRWCKAFNQKREPDEMARRFDKFKDRVLCVRDMNNANASKSYKLGLTKFSDGKLAEMRANEKFPKSLCRRRRGDDKYLMEVYADFDVFNGKLFVFFPVEKGKGVGYCKKEISTEYEVLSGRLFVADLPEGPELLVPNPDVLMHRLIPGYLW